MLDDRKIKDKKTTLTVHTFKESVIRLLTYRP